MGIIQERLRKLDALTLGRGAHPDAEAGLCAMEAAAWIAGEPHSDHPQCVSPVVATFLRAWNDALLDDETRNRLLRDLLPLTIGTRDEHDGVRADLCVRWLVTECAPAFLDLTPALKPHAAALRAATDWREAMDMISAAGAAAGAAARAAAWAAAGAAAGDALQPTVERLQASARELVRSMCEVGR